MNQRWMLTAGVIFLAVVLFVVVGRHKNEQTSAPSSASSGEAKKVYEEAVNLESGGQKLEAKAAYEKLIENYSDFDQMDAVQKHLGDLNMNIIVSSVETTDTEYRSLTFKHVLFPVWISAYRYRGKIFRLLVNARTGEVQGERPWSVMKFVVLGLAIAAAAGLIALVAR